VVHEWLDSYAGSERVLAQILRIYPHADLFAVVDYLSPVARLDLGYSRPVRTTFLQRLPFARHCFRALLPLMPMAMRRLDLSKYDLVISNSHAVAKGVRTRPDQLHVSYVHTPMRYAWDMQGDYLRAAGLRAGPKLWLARYALRKLRDWDVASAQEVDSIVANSHYVASRIRNNWRREASVIHPPVDIQSFRNEGAKEGFYLAASRLVPYKRMDLIVEAFNRMPDRHLVVIGEGAQFARLSRMAGPNVSLVGYQSPAALVDYMQRARAFVFAAEEDFGIVPVEAQACGTPVIAFDRGGVRETVIGLDATDPTGVFFAEQTAESLIGAVREFEAQEFRITREACRKNAERFGEERFRREFRELMERAVAEWRRDSAGRRDGLA
jgi:glycosyltransferase involved in cell wall biosynthesis